MTSEAIYARCLLFYEWAVRAEGVGTCVGDSWPLHHDPIPGRVCVSEDEGCMDGEGEGHEVGEAYLPGEGVEGGHVDGMSMGQGLGEVSHLGDGMLDTRDEGGGESAGDGAAVVHADADAEGSTDGGEAQGPTVSLALPVWVELDVALRAMPTSGVVMRTGALHKRREPLPRPGTHLSAVTTPKEGGNRAVRRWLGRLDQHIQAGDIDDAAAHGAVERFLLDLDVTASEFHTRHRAGYVELQGAVLTHGGIWFG